MADVPQVVLLMSSNAGYDRGILQGIVRYTHEHGPWHLYLAGVEPDLPLPEGEAFCGVPTKKVSVNAGLQPLSLPDLRQWHLSGIIGRFPSNRVAKMALGVGVPVIAVDLSEEQLAGHLPLKQVSEIRSDSHKAGRMAAEHLLERGLRSFGYCGYAGRTWSERSREGFCARIQEAGFVCDVYSAAKRNRPIFWRQERPLVMQWLRNLSKPTGVMCCNDIRGRQVLEACALSEIPVPEEMAVVGVDDDQLLCELSHPTLSSVVLNAERGGYEAAGLLDDLMSGRKRKPQRIDVEPLWILARQSTDVVAVDDPKVAQAVRYIHAHFRTPIGVQDVVEKVGLSRRALELRFERFLGRSIRVEIQRARLNWAKRLLVETNLSVAKIADCTGFNGPNYLTKVFHREAGETPDQYRQRHRPL
jgi:LacI family transcriptional regulator